MNAHARQPIDTSVTGSLAEATRKVPVLLLAAIFAWPAATLAQGSNAASRFQQYESQQAFVPAVVPLGVKGGGRVKVVVVLAAESVAAARARVPERALTSDERRAVVDQVSAEHQGIEPEISGRGGRVLKRFRHALNGIKIEIDRNEVAALAALPGVVAVLPVLKHRPNNAVSVPFIGAPVVWQGTPRLRGEGVKIAIIDTGIDYTHANFGGPGTVAAFQAAAAASTKPADPALFGPNAPKVKGGTDLVGDAYDASAVDAKGNPNPAKTTPHPDPNPLDCNGHGSHVAGTAAGFGVDAHGATYAGPYDSAAFQQGFKIGPGVAPKADLYAVRVFGCNGSTDVVTEAIDWAVENDMDVINMSLGAPFGTAKTSDALAAQNAAKAGIIVVASAGNSGPAPYITGSPASGRGVVSVAAVDSTASFPAAVMGLAGGKSITAIDANGAPLSGGTLSVFVLHTSTGSVSLGCNEAEYVNASIAGKLVVTRRGTCARVDRATFGQRHGAAAVAMINNGAGYPPFEGDIPGVAIPFLGVLTSDAPTLTASATAALARGTLANPGFRAVADFNSGGPRFGDSHLKPNAAAPGVSILSTFSGTGNQGERASGTSMSSPHVAGVAALVRQANPSWGQRALRAALEQTVDPGQLSNFAPVLDGSGLVQPIGATRTQAVAFVEGGDRERGDREGDREDGDREGGNREDGDREGGNRGGKDRDSLSFGFAELLHDFNSSLELKVRNLGRMPIAFKVTATPAGGAPHTVSFDRTTIFLHPRDDASLDVKLKVPAASVGSTHDDLGNTAFREVAGVVTLTPTDASMNGGASLRVPYYLVPRVRSNLLSAFAGRRAGPSRPSSNVRLTNFGGAIAGNADFYAWGLRGTRQGVQFFDPRAVGVQTNPIPATPTSPANSLLVFAVNTFERFSNAAAGEFDILIDVNGDGVPDFLLAGFDLGEITAGSFNGQLASVLVNLSTGAARIRFLADAPTDGSTVLLPVLASDLGITPANPRLTYSAQVINMLDGSAAALPGTASFNAFTPAISNAMFVAVAPNATATVPVAVDSAEWAKTPALGLMVVTQDNRAGAPQARLIEAGR